MWEEERDPVPNDRRRTGREGIPSNPQGSDKLDISKAVSANPCYYRHDPGSAPGLPSTSGKQEGQAQSVVVVLSCGNHHLEDNHKEWHYDSYAEVLKRGITAAGVGSPGAGAALIPLKPITDADRFDALGISNCPEEVVGSLVLSSSVHIAPSHPQGGDPRQCTNTEQLRRNLADMRQQFAAPGAQVVDAAFSSLVSRRDTSAKGFRLKSIIKKPKWPKQKRSPPSNHHVYRNMFGCPCILAPLKQLAGFPFGRLLWQLAELGSSGLEWFLCFFLVSLTVLQPMSLLATFL
ncbi:hypothetical protein Nepgr_005239 [Nepenthes gracilis]|uniref:Uncharacterized protein n=1 Tax=Nepenthes gracilis TaxID=150966 RepID=A0AAD3S2T0_NEPGR|nr:hypothetical protein Nepgr_005239 [Nepenthes gracilis]